MKLFERLISIYAPSRCLICAKHGEALCTECREGLSSNKYSRCYLCGKQTKDSATCSKCRKNSPLENVWAAAEYKGTVKDLIRKFKFERLRSAADVLAELLDEAVPYLADDVIVTHVPTASSRVRARGYDHAALLAEAFAKRRGLQHVELLGRVGQSRQVGSRRTKRLEQLKDAYRQKHSGEITGKEILLIDDISTTGATLTSASLVLARSGANLVLGAVSARKA